MAVRCWRNGVEKYLYSLLLAGHETHNIKTPAGFLLTRFPDIVFRGHRHFERALRGFFRVPTGLSRDFNFHKIPICLLQGCHRLNTGILRLPYANVFVYLESLNSKPSSRQIILWSSVSFQLTYHLDCGWTFFRVSFDTPLNESA